MSGIAPRPGVLDPKNVKAAVGPVQPATLASLYPQVVPDAAVGQVSAYAGFSSAARRAAQVKGVDPSGVSSAHQQLHQPPIPPTVSYPASSLLTQQHKPIATHSIANNGTATPVPTAKLSSISSTPGSSVSTASSVASSLTNTTASSLAGSVGSTHLMPAGHVASNRSANLYFNSTAASTATPSVLPPASSLTAARTGPILTTAGSSVAAVAPGPSSSLAHSVHGFVTAGTPAALAVSSISSSGLNSSGPLAAVSAGSSLFSVARPTAAGNPNASLGNPNIVAVGGVGHALQLQAQQVALQLNQQQKVSLDVGQQLNALTCSPDRTMLAVGGKEVKIIQHQNGKFLPVKHLNTNSKTPTALSDIQWHPLESYKHWLLTAPTNGKILLYNLTSKEGLKRSERMLEDHERTVNRIVWHPRDGELLFSGSQDGTVKMFDLRVNTPKAALSLSDHFSVRDVQVNPFATHILAAAYENGTMQIWDTRKAGVFHTINAHQGLILTLDWHPDDSSILASGGVDRAIKVWNINIGASNSSITSDKNNSGSSAQALQNNPNQASAAQGGTGLAANSTHQMEPLHTVQTVASVGRVKWRPSHRYPFQIASAANLIDCKIHVWNVHKPFTPLVSLLGHKDVITGFYFSDCEARDSSPATSTSTGSPVHLLGNEIISCSKDSTIQQHFLYIDHQLNPNYHLTVYPNEELRTSAIAWNIKGNIATVNDYIDRTNRILVPDTVLTQPFSFTAHSPQILNAQTVSSASTSGTSSGTNSVAGSMKPTGASAAALNPAVLASILQGNAAESLRNGFMRIFNGSLSTLNHLSSQSPTSPEGSLDSNASPSPLMMLTEEEVFVHFARQYKFTATPSFTSSAIPLLIPNNYQAPKNPAGQYPSFMTLALHNSEVARAAHQMELSQIWLVLAQLLGHGFRKKEEESKGPPPLPMDEHSVAAKLKEEGKEHPNGGSRGSTVANSTAAGAGSGISIQLHPTTYISASSMNPSTIYQHRQTSSLFDATNSIPSHNRHRSSLTIHTAEEEKLAQQFLQIELVSQQGLRTNSSFHSSKNSLDASVSPSGALSPRSPSGSPDRSPSPNGSRVPDPTQTISALNRSQIFLDCLPTIHKSHCYTLQNPNYAGGWSRQFSNGSQHSATVSPYVSNPYNSSLHLLSSLSFQATLLNNSLEFSIERGDVQTCVAVISLLKEFHPTVIQAMDEAEKANNSKQSNANAGHSLNDRFKHWYWAYIDLLQRHELYSHASELIQLCNDVDLKKMNQKSTTISLICPVCKHASQQVGIGCTNKMCGKTRMTNCSLCQLPVTGVYVWCQGCGHGGHMDHLQDWFNKHSFCPTGCLHRCVELLTTGRA